MELELTVPQTKFFVNNTSEYVAAVAGFGSGKTESAAVKIAARTIEYPKINQAYLAPTYKLIADIFYPRITELLEGAGFRVRINKQENNVHVDGLGIIYCRTMDNPDMIVGWECGDAFMDELDILPTDKAQKVMTKVSARCRQKYPDGKVNQKHVTTTPEGFKATYQMFKKDPLSNSQLIQMSTYSNEHNLPPGYIKGLRDQYPDQLIEAYINGNFVNLVSGSVYYAYDRDRCNTHVVAKPREPLHIGMDFNVYNMAGIVNVLRDGYGYAVDELIGLRDTPDMIDAINEKFPEHNVTVYPDASGNSKSSKGATLSDIKLLREAGFKIKADKANPLIKDRVQSMNNAFDKSKYFVNVERCPEFSNCLEQQIYNTVGVPDKSTGLDHPNDAGGYFVHKKFPINVRKAFTQQVSNY